ncbi:MAG TPA: tRNA pseudouridine(55) synthase TruB [Candidatus Eisenbacteria bacterium]|nr:tRNA pseudouridine(55) synthase TruB [Candidatus Eisenbacteria bacterium]
MLIDKPEGITSHDVVDRLRRITGVQRIGHAGTLDPFATGLLVVGVGRGATKRLSEVMGQDKVYEATAVLGATSDTQDKTGKITDNRLQTTDAPSVTEVGEAMVKFVGPLKQVPPMYSAKKIRGEKLYELARRGEEVVRQPVDIVIHELVLLSFEPPKLTFRVRCSSGTYVRTLAHDLGTALGVGAYLSALRRTAIGGFRVEDAATLEDLSPENWQERLFQLKG